MREKREGKKFNRCPECGSSNIIYDYDSGEIICGDCGLVLSELVIDEGPEWRAFTQGEREKRSRVGVPMSFSVHDKGLTTTITLVDKDAFGRKLPLDARLQMLRLRKWQIRSRIHSSVDRNLAQAMAELDRLCDKLHIPSAVKEKAAVIYRKALDAGLVRGRSIAAIVAAALYAACRLMQIPRSLKEISKHSTANRKDIARSYRLLLTELNIKMPIPQPELRVPKIAAKLGVDGETQKLAIQILRKAEKLKSTAGKDPTGLAAAALYIACLMRNKKFTQKKVAEAAGVTEVTIRNRYKGLKEALGLNV